MDSTEQAQNVSLEMLASQSVLLESATKTSRASGQDSTSLIRHSREKLTDIYVAGVLGIASLDLFGESITSHLEVVEIGAGLTMGAVISSYYRFSSIIRSAIRETPLHSNIDVLVARSGYESIKKGDTVINFYPGEPVSRAASGSTKGSNEQLLELQDLLFSVKYDHVILPAKQINLVATSVSKSHTRQEIVQTLTGCSIDKSPLCNVRFLSKVDFEELICNLENVQSNTRLRAILNQLNTRFPNPYVSYYLDQKTDLNTARPQIYRYLTGTMLKGLENELDLTARPLQAPVLEDGISKQYLSTELRTVKGELIVQQFNQFRKVVYSYKASDICGINENPSDMVFSQKVTDGHYSLGQLSYAAITMLHDSSDELDVAKVQSDENKSVFSSPQPLITGKLIDTEIIRHERRNSLKRRIYIGISVLAIASLFRQNNTPEAGTIPSSTENYKSSAIGKANSSDKPVWQ